MTYYMGNGIKFQKINFAPPYRVRLLNLVKSALRTDSKLHPFIFHCNIGNNIILLVIFVFPDHFHRLFYVEVSKYLFSKNLLQSSKEHNHKVNTCLRTAQTA